MMPGKKVFLHGIVRIVYHLQEPWLPLGLPKMRCEQKSACMSEGS